MDILSTREIAALIWVMGLLFLGLCKDDVVNSIKGVLKAFFDIRIIAVFEALAVYLILICYLIFQFFDWGLSEIKGAIFWYLFVGSVGLFKNAMTDETSNPVKDWIVTNVRFVILVEFLVSKYTFPLWGELVLLPILSLIVMMMVFAESKKEYKQVFGLLEWVLAIVGIFLAWHAVKSFWQDDTVNAGGILLEFSLPILYSLASIPFFYGLHVYSNYNEVFSRFSLSFEDEGFRKEVKSIAICRFGVRIKRLRRWNRIIQTERPKTIENVHASIDYAVNQETLERNPPNVKKEDGWSPYKAKEFLSGYGYKTGYYSEYTDGWRAFSNSKNAVLEGFCQSYLHYNIIGTENIANTLELVLTVNDEKQLEEAYKVLMADIQHLINCATPDIPHIDELENMLRNREGNITNNETIWKLEYEIIEVPNLIIYEFRFSILKFVTYESL